jgi:hypothetical protein
MGDFHINPYLAPSNQTPINAPISNVAGPIHNMSAVEISGGDVLVVWTQLDTATDTIRIRQGLCPTPLDFIDTPNSVVFQKDLVTIFDSTGVGLEEDGRAGAAHMQLGPDGNLWLSIWARSDVYTFDPSFDPFPGPQYGAWVYRSTDEGATWDHVSTLSLTFNQLGWGYGFGVWMIPGEIVEIPAGWPDAGRWVMMHNNCGNYFGAILVGSGIYISDDQGVTWTRTQSYTVVYGDSHQRNISLRPSDQAVYVNWEADGVLGLTTRFFYSIDSGATWVEYYAEAASANPTPMFVNGCMNTWDNGERFWLVRRTTWEMFRALGAVPTYPNNDWLELRDWAFVTGLNPGTQDHTIVQHVGAYAAIMADNQVLGLQEQQPGIPQVLSRAFCSGDEPFECSDVPADCLDCA